MNRQREKWTETATRKSINFDFLIRLVDDRGGIYRRCERQVPSRMSNVVANRDSHVQPSKNHLKNHRQSNDRKDDDDDTPLRVSNLSSEPSTRRRTSSNVSS